MRKLLVLPGLVKLLLTLAHAGDEALAHGQITPISNNRSLEDLEFGRCPLRAILDGNGDVLGGGGSSFFQGYAGIPTSMIDVYYC